LIIWINGAYGSGKSTVSDALQKKIVNSNIYDPENAGNFIRENLPLQMWKDDFQDYRLWRLINFEMIKYLANNYDGTIIIPMTIVNIDSYNETIIELSKIFDVKHFILYAGSDILLKRNLERGEEPDSWCIAQIDRCINAFENNIKGTVINTEYRGIDLIVEEILNKI
jgi:tRNA uridine 5-carbamoylmethylation protein Kti12